MQSNRVAEAFKSRGSSLMGDVFSSDFWRRVSRAAQAAADFIDELTGIFDGGASSGSSDTSSDTSSDSESGLITAGKCDLDTRQVVDILSEEPYVSNPTIQKLLQAFAKGFRVCVYYSGSLHIYNPYSKQTTIIWYAST